MSTKQSDTIMQSDQLNYSRFPFKVREVFRDYKLNF